MTAPDAARIDARMRRLRDRLLSRGAPSLVPGREVTEDDALTERVRPFAELMYLVMTAGADPGDAERAALRGALRILTDGRVNAGWVEALTDELEAARKAEGRDARIGRAAARLVGSREDSELALALSFAVAAADD